MTVALSDTDAPPLKRMPSQAKDGIIAVWRGAYLGNTVQYTQDDPQRIKVYDVLERGHPQYRSTIHLTEDVDPEARVQKHWSRYTAAHLRKQNATERNRAPKAHKISSDVLADRLSTLAHSWKRHGLIEQERAVRTRRTHPHKPGLTIQSLGRAEAWKTAAEELERAIEELIAPDK